MGSLKTTKLAMFATLGLFFLILVHACGGGSNKGGTELASSSAVSSAPGPLIPIPLGLVESRLSSSLNLAGSAPGSVTPTTIGYDLTGCTSGLSGIPASQSVVNVYLKDTGCYVKLVSFVLNGTTYNLTNFGAVAFSPALASGSTGQVATFAGASSTDLITILSVSQLSSTNVASDYVSYEFTIIKSGTNSAAITVSSAQSIYTAGQDAPNFVINSGGGIFDNIISSGPSTGYGQFTFKLTCVTGAMTVGANASYNSFCPTITPGGTIAGGARGVDVGNTSEFSYKLINNINGNGTLTLAQAQSAFASGDSTVTLATDILPSSTGFKTLSLTGPGVITSNQTMLLVLQAKNSLYPTNPLYSSFQYFAITLPTVNP